MRWGPTFNGRAGDNPAALQASIVEQLRSKFDTELADRESRNQQYAVDDIDPFVVTADISDCPECQPKDESPLTTTSAVRRFGGSADRVAVAQG